MAKGISKCKLCDIDVPTKEAKMYSGKKYCDKCYQIKMQEKSDYDNLIKSIMYYFNLEIPTGLILKQIKEYKEQFNYTYGGMQYCLYFCSDIKRLKFDSKYGIAIIKYEYENAKNYYLQQQKIADSVSNINHEEKVKTIKVNIKKQGRGNMLINIDNLIKDGEN